MLFENPSHAFLESRARLEFFSIRPSRKIPVEIWSEKKDLEITRALKRKTEHFRELTIHFSGRPQGMRG